MLNPEEVLQMAGLTAAIVATLLVLSGPQQPPRDPARPAPPPPVTATRDSAATEVELAEKIAASPTTLPLYYELSRLQERRGAFAEAEATLLRAKDAARSDKTGVVALAAFYSRRGLFDQAIAAWETVAQIDGSDPQTHVMVAAAYWEKVTKDKALAPSQQLTDVREAVSATDRALALDADNAQALNFKSLLLKHRATLETDPAQKQALAAEAEALRTRATEINKIQARGPGSSDTSGSRPDMGRPGATGAPLRVGGNIPPPTKLRDVKPIYPPEAQSAGIQGVVILEVTIGADGRVSDARVLRSIPPLDDAALGAVRGWEFTPTLLNGVPVPVIMTVTVNFTLP
jgi:TonB family protein